MEFTGQGVAVVTDNSEGTISVFFEIDKLKEKNLLICIACTNVPTVILDCYRCRWYLLRHL